MMSQRPLRGFYLLAELIQPICCLNCLSYHLKFAVESKLKPRASAQRLSRVHKAVQIDWQTDILFTLRCKFK